jgi:hypothetical protein
MKISKKFVEQSGFHFRISHHSIFTAYFFLCSVLDEFCPKSQSEAPALDAGQVYFGTEAGVLHAVSDLTGEKSWEFQSDGPIISAVVWHLGTKRYQLNQDHRLEHVGTSCGEKM